MSEASGPISKRSHHDDFDELDMDGIDNIVRSEDSTRADDSSITATTLANEYLPALFKTHGRADLSIRHITNHLDLNVPAFNQLPAGRQRRLVVKALESKRGTVFEKVGWGRWSLVESHPEGMFTFDSPRVGSLPRGGRPPLLGSYPSFQSQDGGFITSPAVSCNNREEDEDIDPLALDDDDDPETDEEDWKSIGVEGLKQRVSASSPSFRSFLKGPYPMSIRRQSSAGVFQLNSGPLRSFQKSSPIRIRSEPKFQDKTRQDEEAIKALVMLAGSSC